MSLYIPAQTLQQFKRVQTLLNQLQPDAAPQALAVSGSPQPHASVIVFPGSFNPPTVAHLALLKQAHQFARQRQATYLYAAFSKRTVDKESVERPLLLDRVMLLKRILQTRLPETGILLFNCGLYVEQAQAIRASFPQVTRIIFLMGFDKIVQIFDPHYYADRDAALKDLFAQAALLVAPRGNEGERDLQKLLQQPQNGRFAHFVHALPLNKNYRDISSTIIRQENGSQSYDVPQEVRLFMRETRAYAPPVRRPDGSLVDSYEQRVEQLRKLLASTACPRRIEKR